MKIVIAGGKNEADFLISSLLQKHHELMVVNEDEGFCQYLSQRHKMPVFHGDPGKIYTLEDAGVRGYDIIIALSSYDSDNLAICQAAKKLLNIRRAVAIVSNPKNVEVFKKLGVNTAISATYMLTTIIEQASTVDNMLNSVPVEHDKLILTELLLDQNSACDYRQIQELELPRDAVVAGVLRGDKILPYAGELLLLPHDKVLILSSPSEQGKIIDLITKGRFVKEKQS